MTNNMLILAFSAWVLYHAWRGFRAGVWAGVFGILALAMAYAASLFFGGRAAVIIANLGFSERVALFSSYVAIFLIVNTLVRYLPFIIVPALKRKGRAHVWLGGGLGAFTGIVTGLLGVWFIGVAELVLSARSGGVDHAGQGAVVRVSAGAEPEAPKTDALRNLATKFVARTAELTTSAAGMEENNVITVSAMLRQPDVVMGGMQSLMKSEQMHALLRSEHVRRMMALNDVSSMQNSREFRSVMALPEMQTMTNSLQLQGGDAQKSERFIAEQMTHIWRRMEYLKNDARAQALLKDPELQAALQSNNPMALMANTKYQQLVALILNGTTNVSETEFNQVLLSSVRQVSDPALQSTNVADLEEGGDAGGIAVKPYRPQTVYKWRDDHGKWQYSDWERIPVSKRGSAEVMTR